MIADDMLKLGAPGNKEMPILQEWSELSRHGWTQEVMVATALSITRQAAIARLSGLVRKGWLRADGSPGLMYWVLTPAGRSALSMIVN